jgi:hypothetical protein
VEALADWDSNTMYDHRGQHQKIIDGDNYSGESAEKLIYYTNALTLGDGRVSRRWV